MNSIIVALIAFLGTAIGSIVGVLTANTPYRSKLTTCRGCAIL